MLATDTIREYDAGIPGVFAFRITGEVDRDAMAAMSRRMSDVFDAAEDKVDMLLVFETDETSTPGASLSADAMKAQTQSLAKVRHYVVANAPGQAGGIVETMGKLMPVEAKSFDSETEAIAYLNREATRA
jgi:hypothetical protein